MKITSSLSNKAIARMQLSSAKEAVSGHVSRRARSAQYDDARLSSLPEKMNSLRAPPRQLGWVSQTFNSKSTISSTEQFTCSARICKVTNFWILIHNKIACSNNFITLRNNQLHHSRELYFNASTNLALNKSMMPRK